MDSSCNFKTFLYGKWIHVYNLIVLCYRGEVGGYFYTVRGVTYGNDTVFLSYETAIKTAIFETCAEAYKFLDKIVAKYPPYGDKRDYDIELAPVYEGVER